MIAGTNLMGMFNTTLLIAALVLASASQGAFADAAEARLAAAIAARSEDQRARDEARHPAETLRFFDVQPGMTVAECLPGDGWYTRILANYLGRRGTLYGVNYAARMWPMFSFATPEWVDKRIASTEKFSQKVREYTLPGDSSEAGASVKARGFTFSTIPPEVVGTVDRVLIIRALHNLFRFEADSGTLTQAMAAVRGMLKPGGLVGVVQHRAPESASDEWANGDHGYLKQSAVIALFEQAGFELVATSEVNANPSDKPGPEDSVWRLPPSLRTSKEDPELRTAMMAIGESDRMTLLFRKTN
jgi:predicted methyltransferase